MMTRIVCLCCFLVFSPCWAAQQTLPVGKSAKQLPFWPGKKQVEGGVVFVNGEKNSTGEHLSEVFAQRLAKKGWSVVFINNKPDWAKNIPDALSALRQKGAHKLVVIHYGDRLSKTLNYFNKPHAKQLNGLILLSAYDSKNCLKAEKNLSKTTFPAYDVSGQFEYHRIMKQVKARRKSMKKKANYSSLLFPGARHDYTYSVNGVASYLSAWMKRLPVSEKVANLPKSPF